MDKAVGDMRFPSCIPPCQTPTDFPRLRDSYVLMQTQCRQDSIFRLFLWGRLMTTELRPCTFLLSLRRFSI